MFAWKRINVGALAHFDTLPSSFQGLVKWINSCHQMAFDHELTMDHAPTDGQIADF